MTRVLLVNDDGVEAPGLVAFRTALLAAGLRVTTIAPSGNRSGVSRAVTVHGDVHVRELAGGDDPVLAVDGTPVDCVRIGLLSPLGGEPALVVSGINRGINLGDDITYSGTVGGALEAGLLGVAALAVSQQGDDGGTGLVERGSHSYDLAPLAAALAVRMLQEPPPSPVVLNVNLPAALDPATPVVRARPGRRAYAPGWLAPVAGPEPGTWTVRAFAGSGVPPVTEDGADVDFGVVRRGGIALTPLTLDGRLGEPAALAAWLDVLLPDGLIKRGQAPGDKHAG